MNCVSPWVNKMNRALTMQGHALRATVQGGRQPTPYNGAGLHGGGAWVSAAARFVKHGSIHLVGVEVNFAHVEPDGHSDKSENQRGDGSEGHGSPHDAGHDGHTEASGDRGRDQCKSKGQPRRLHAQASHHDKRECQPCGEAKNVEWVNGHSSIQVLGVNASEHISDTTSEAPEGQGEVGEDDHSNHLLGVGGPAQRITIGALTHPITKGQDHGNQGNHDLLRFRSSIRPAIENVDPDRDRYTRRSGVLHLGSSLNSGSGSTRSEHRRIWAASRRRAAATRFAIALRALYQTLGLSGSLNNSSASCCLSRRIACTHSFDGLDMTCLFLGMAEDDHRARPFGLLGVGSSNFPTNSSNFSASSAPLGTRPFSQRDKRGCGMPVPAEIASCDRPRLESDLRISVTDGVRMNRDYAQLDCQVNPSMHYLRTHNLGMRWHEFIAALVEREGGTNAAAKAMGRPTFQGTLHRIVSGGTPEPTRKVAERIARHYKIDVDALYSDAVAQREAVRTGILPPQGGAAIPALPELPDAALDAPLTKVLIYTLDELAKKCPTVGMVGIEAPDDLQGCLIRGADVYIDVTDRRKVDGAVVLVKRPGPSAAIGLCRLTASGFEVETSRGMFLDSERHALQIMGTATELRKVLRK